MALLNVVAAADDVTAAPGNANAVVIVVSVTDSLGNAVSGLVASNFAVSAKVVAPGGAGAVVISAVTPPVGSGFFNVNVIPPAGQTWKGGGPYIFAVTVTNGADRGQTVASVLVD